MESNGPDVKVRGTAQQVLDKYLALARDAYSAGDRVAAEAYFQYADHYHRVVNGSQGGSYNGQGGAHRGPNHPPPPVSRDGKEVAAGETSEGDAPAADTTADGEPVSA